MNKKSFLMVVFALFLATSIFAADNYVVKTVDGKVTYESAPGKWKAVAEGQELSGATVINTSLNSTFIILDGDKEISIKAMSKGTISSLIGSATAKAGLKKSGGSLKTSKIGDDVEGNTKGTGTASTRSYEGKADVDWDD